MYRPVIVAAATALVSLTAAGGYAAAHYCAGPAADFAAYYYRSPGGIARAQSAATADGTGSTLAPYRQSCGKGRVWKDDRCVRE